ncbi:HAD-like domain-containing protein, partial [Sporodiniella umbellata]
LVYSTFLSAGVSSKVLDPNFDQMFHGIYNRFTTAEAYSVFPDVLRTLKELEQKGFKMGVISNSDERVVKIIESLKLNKYFDFVLASSIAGYEKPNKAIFDQALSLAGSIPAESAFHVGDDVEK